MVLAFASIHASDLRRRVVGLLLLGHLPGDFCHEPGAEVGEHAVDDAGDVGWIFGCGSGSILRGMFCTCHNSHRSRLRGDRHGFLGFLARFPCDILSFTGVTNLTPTRPSGRGALHGFGFLFGFSFAFAILIVALPGVWSGSEGGKGVARGRGFVPGRFGFRSALRFFGSTAGKIGDRILGRAVGSKDVYQNIRSSATGVVLNGTLG